MHETGRYFQNRQVAFFIDSSVTIYPPSLPMQKEFCGMLIDAIVSLPSDSMPKAKNVLLHHDFSLVEIGRAIYREAGPLYFKALEIFNSSGPNSLHHELAGMMAGREIRFLIDNTLDDCMEKALAVRGCIPGKDFLSISDDPHLQSVELESPLPILVKFNRKTGPSDPVFYADGLGKGKTRLLSYLFKKCYSVFMGMDAVSPHFHTFILETLPCSCPGIACIAKNENTIRGIHKANAFYGHNVKTIELSDEQFLRDLLQREVRPFGVDEEREETRRNQREVVKKWAQEVGSLGCHEILASLCDMVGEYNAALDCREEAEKIAKGQMNANSFAHIFKRLGDSYSALQEPTLALQHFEKSLNIYQKLNQSLQIAGLYMSFGDLYFRQQQWDLSVKHYARAMEIYEHDQEKLELAETYRKSGYAYERSGEYGDALVCYEKSTQLYKDIQSLCKVARVCNQMGRVFFYKKEIEKANECYYQAQEMALECGDIETIARVYSNLAVISFSEKDYEKAYKLYRRAGIIFDQLKENEGAAAVYYNLGLLTYSKNQTDKARRYLKKASECLTKSPNKQEYQKIKELLTELDYVPNDNLTDCNPY